MRRVISVCVLVAVLGLAARAQSSGVENDEMGRIVSLENAWNQAELKHDTDGLNLLLAETFEYTDADGSFMNRTEWLAHVKNEVDQYEQLGNRKMKVRIYGQAAVVTGEYREKIKLGGKPVVRSGRFTDTWIQQNGQWKCVASQATLIRD